MSATPIRERMGLTLLVAYVSTGLSQLASQAFFFLILRFLPVEGVGLYSWAIAIATIYAYVLDLGLAIFLVGELSGTRYTLKVVLQFILWMRLPLVVLGGAGLAGWVAWSHPSAEEYWTLTLVGGMYVVQLIDLGLAPWFQVHQRQNVVNVVALIVPLGRLLGIGLPLLVGARLHLSAVVGISLATQLAATACLLGLAMRDRRVLEASGESGAGLRELLRRFWARGPRLTVMYSLNILQARLDWLLVSALISRVALANYSLANKVVELTMLLAGVWARTSFPWLSRADADEPHLQRRLVLLRRLFVVSSGLLGVGLYFWSPLVVEFFFGNKYAEANGSLRLMTLATVVFMLNQYLFYVLLAVKQEKAYTWLILIGALLQVGVDVVLLPRIGIIGAAWGMIVMAGAMHLGQLVLLRRCGVLSAGEIVRWETFIVVLVGVSALVSWGGAGPIIGTLAVGVLAAITGAFLVLDRMDREQLCGWIKRSGREPGIA
jgi:O-antigen/teichoic acid export membrane protein